MTQPQSIETPISLGVIVVTWNSGVELVQTIQSVTEQANAMPHLQWHGIVWDNASSNSVAKTLALPDSKWQIHFANENLGFATANNEAAKKLPHCDWLLLINPDAHLSEQALFHLVQAASKRTKYAAIGPSLCAWPDVHTLDGLGDIVHASGLAWRDGFKKSANVLDQLSDPYETSCVSGAALMLRADVFRDIGGFDEDFFCYQEDVDLGLRLRLMGYTAVQVPKAVAFHVGSQSTGGHRSDFSVYHGRRNMVWCYVKNMPALLFWLFLPLHLMLNAVDLLFFTFAGQGKIIWRAKRDAIKGLPKMWHKRRLIQARRVATVRDIWRALDKRLLPWGFKAIRAKSGRKLSGR